jgi:hypothetical protein
MKSLSICQNRSNEVTNYILNQRDGISGQLSWHFRWSNSRLTDMKDSNLKSYAKPTQS